MTPILMARIVFCGMLLAWSIVGAAEQKGATIRISGKSIAFGVGFWWGSGVLTFQGKHYPVTVDGVSAGDVGITKAELSGEVLNLDTLEDIVGTYTTLAAGMTMGGGGMGLTMKNQNGVIIKARASAQGFNFQLGVDGIRIDFK